jgi:hypothetical protein
MALRAGEQGDGIGAAGSQNVRRQNEPPTRHTDTLLALRWDYFYPCEVLRGHLLEERARFLASTAEEVSDRQLVYLSHWLSSLWVVAHAFRYVLKLPDRSIEKLIDLHFRDLSEFRNATYHYHRGPEKHLAFYTNLKAMVWAEELHQEFRRYFFDYECLLASLYPEIPIEEWRYR